MLGVEPGDLGREADTVTLQPGDIVERTGDSDIMRFLVVPDGYGGVFLKSEQDVTDADYDTIGAYRAEEIAFLGAEYEKDAGTVARHEAANADFDAELRALVDDQEEG